MDGNTVVRAIQNGNEISLLASSAFAPASPVT